MRSTLPDSVGAVPQHTRPGGSPGLAARASRACRRRSPPPATASTRCCATAACAAPSPEQTAESLLRGAHASAVLEGSASTLDEVRAGDGRRGRAGRRCGCQHEPALAGAGRRALAAAGAGPAARAGAAGAADERGRPATPEAADRLPALASALGAATAAPALLVAAVVHAELATAAPFASHNGIVARAAERLVLVARGVDAKSLVVPEAGHLALRAAYESNLRGYADGGRAGPARLAALRRRGSGRGGRGEPAAWR